ncbi:MAG: fructosamine kinase family protein [Candidatus Cloacimonetes bacterium]|nr:fructosamine kinase family protein [Candidatus Cloacimonadota bacterium]
MTAQRRKDASHYLKHWNLIQDGDEILTHSSLLLPVRKNAEPLMLKIVDLNDDEALAWQILKIYNGRGAVFLVDASGPAQLLERITPDERVADLESMVLSGKEEQALDILCQSVINLQTIVRESSSFKPVNSFHSRILEMQKHMQSRVFLKETQSMLQSALSVSLELEKDHCQIPLHGDLHHFNLLNSKTRGWLAIDPKGIYGSREYDFAIPLCNPYPHTDLVACPKRMKRLARRIETNYGFCAELILKYTWIHALQVGAWSTDPDCHQYWLACAKAAVRA